ncbi:MAG: hypothetical protein FJ100_21565 [Deltaproteobacteria bacterium]|nr:hypothetical protein [Deltaproteobacteria bacterium]
MADRLEDLARKVEAAGGDPQALVPLADAFDQELGAARSALGDVSRGLSEGDQRTLQAHFGLRVGPTLSRLQVLLFAAHLARLPRGATPAAAPATPTHIP